MNFSFRSIGVSSERGGAYEANLELVKVTCYRDRVLARGTRCHSLVFTFFLRLRTSLAVQ
jgi:hypothetical protein